MGIAPKQLASLLQSQNQIINTGEISAGEQQLRIVANGTYTTVDDIRNQVITTSGGQVKLGDIAIIEKGYMEPPGNIMHVNGKRAIGIGISTDPTKDVVKTGELVDRRLAELMPLIPVGLELESLYPENVIAQEANNGFIINLIESILIVIVIIMLVMGMRAGVLIGSSLIFSIGGTLLIMSFLGVGLNRTSLAGFIIAMGMLVDNAIVVTDQCPNCHCPRHRPPESADRRCHRPPMGIAGSNVHSHLFVSATVSGSLFRSRNRETAIRSAGHFPGIKLGAGVDTNHYIRQLHTESKGKRWW